MQLNGIRDEQQRPSRDSVETFRVDSSPSEKSPNQATVQIDTNDETNALVAKYESQLDNLVHQLKLTYEMEATKFKLVQAETLNHA